MFTTDKRQEEILFKTYRIKQELPFVVTLFNETHDLEVSVIYDEEEDNATLISIKIDANTPYEFAEGEDVGDITHTMIGDWFDDKFGINRPHDEDALICGDIGDVFGEVWEFMERKGMV